MSTHFGKLNLASLKSHRIVEFPQGKEKNAPKIKCIVIPIEKNGLFHSEKGNVFVDLVIFDLKTPQTDKDGAITQTHIIKQSLPKDVREKMTKEEQLAMPIIGSLCIIDGNTTQVEKAAVQDDSFSAPDTGDDLPF